MSWNPRIFQLHEEPKNCNNCCWPCHSSCKCSKVFLHKKVWIFNLFVSNSFSKKLVCNSKRQISFWILTLDRSEKTKKNWQLGCWISYSLTNFGWKYKRLTHATYQQWIIVCALAASCMWKHIVWSISIKHSFELPFEQHKQNNRLYTKDFFSVKWMDLFWITLQAFTTLHFDGNFTKERKVNFVPGFSSFLMFWFWSRQNSNLYRGRFIITASYMKPSIGQKAKLHWEVYSLPP